MSKADDAYKLAERQIAKAIADGETRLVLSLPELEEIPPEIAKLSELEYLDLGKTNITTIAPITGLSNLTWLNLNDTKLSEFGSLSKLKHLSTLKLSGTAISDLHCLSELTQLRILTLESTPVTTLHPLEGKGELEFLTITDTQVTDASPIARISALNTLYIHRCPIADLRPLKNLDGLATTGHKKGLWFKDCLATRIDPKLMELSNIGGVERRTRETLAYLKSLKDWPPSEALPEDRPNTTRYVVPDNGPIQAAGEPIGPNDPEQQSLQDECREKIRSLIASVREGDNELAALVDTAKKYLDLIDKAPTEILASSLWSAANTLRARHEAHQSADAQARLNDMLPPNTAAALLDLLETHGLFFLGHPGAAEIERKRREFLSGTRNPEARGDADRLTTSLAKNPEVLDPDAAAALAHDNEAAKGEGPSAEMAEASLFDRIQNIVGAVARRARSLGATAASVATGAIFSDEIVAFWKASKPVIVAFYETVTTRPDAWLYWLMSLF